MAAAPSSSAVLGLYRGLLRAARGFTNYNFREYSLRCVRDDYRAKCGLSDADAITRAYEDGRVQLAMLQRQSTISRLFPQGKHAMET